MSYTMTVYFTDGVFKFETIDEVLEHCENDPEASLNWQRVEEMVILR